MNLAANGELNEQKHIECNSDLCQFCNKQTQTLSLATWILV
jgi:hypothetical protein